MKFSFEIKPNMKSPCQSSLTLGWLLLVLLQIQLTFSFSSSVGQNDTDKKSLLAFKDLITNDPLLTLHSWNESLHFCQWYGVTCGRRHQRVVKLELPSNKLEGILTPHIGNMSFLRILNLTHNGLGQTLPQQLGRLLRLQVLGLDGNKFVGEIPANISYCSNLRELWLGRNKLTGKLPTQLGLLGKLQELVFEVNNLVGEIPPTFGNLSSLSSIWGETNALSGKIPKEIGRLNSLSTFSLGDNNLMGTIPSSLYNLSTLALFSVGLNQLDGTLPSNLGENLPIIEVFSIADNHFIGKVPLSFSNLSSLLYFQIPLNNFTGKMPTLERAQNLRYLLIYYNNLGNAESDDLRFLHPLVNNTSLEVLDLTSNNLGGMLPKTISNFSRKLRWMRFGENPISGSIPIDIGNLFGLEFLSLGTNLLTGHIPTSIGRMLNMKRLFLYENRLSGIIPSSLGNVTLLLQVDMNSNKLLGNIPASLGNCHGMTHLSFGDNSLSGPIPEQVISGLSSLVLLNLDNNQLTGTIPLGIGKLMNLEDLHLSMNKLSGEIPGSLGNCVALEILMLGENFFNGNIPSTLTSLKGLQYWNVSHNNLSGSIPKFLAELNLSSLDLSYNEFIGEVPMQGIFKNASAVSIEGNKKLCGGVPALLLPRCAEDKPTTSRSSKIPKVAISIVLVCAVLGVILMASFIVACALRKKRQNPASVALGVIHFPKLSFQDLQKATEMFSSANLIGVGGFGSVYRGLLSDGTSIAVKVINLLHKGAARSFMAECEALSKIRHRNLVRVLTVCSSIDFQGNDFKALVYEYMANGSLESWLHPTHTSDDAAQPKFLNLIQRLNISIDVACALDYLHHHCQPPLVHCDLKPSNVLLDGDNTAHVGDFGLARFLREDSDDLLSSHQTGPTSMYGTVGYAAPEYGIGSKATRHGDVYSFGILLLELFTGKKPTDDMFIEELSLHNFAKIALPDHVKEVVDPMIMREIDQAQGSYATRRVNHAGRSHNIVIACLASILNIGVLCSSESPTDRIDISSVLDELHRVKGILLKTRQNEQPEFIVQTEGESSKSKASIVSSHPE